MSCAYQYGVEMTPQPAAMPNVSAPEEICSRPVYGVTKTSVSASRSGNLPDREEAVVELDVIFEPEVGYGLLQRQPVLLALAARDVRMGAPGDHVQHFRVTLDDRRQRLDHRLDALPFRDQPEGREHETLLVGAVHGRRRRSRRAPAHARPRAGRARPAPRAARSVPCPPRTCRSSTSRFRAVSVITITRSAWRHSAASTFGLMTRRLRQHGVQRHHERLRQLLGERSHIGSVTAAEDAVFVLEQDDVDVEPAQDPGRACVVAANRLGDRGRDARSLRAGRLVDDHDLLDAVDPVQAKEG